MRTAAQTQLCEIGCTVFVTDQERKIEIGAQLGYSDLASRERRLGNCRPSFET
jgi:hypothetical protein